MERIAIMGGLGLQGSRLSTRLKADGHYVKVFDNGQRGHNSPSFDAIEQIDLRYSIPDLETFDVVYHLAAHLGGVEYTHAGHDHRMMLDNMSIDSNVIEGAAYAKVKKFVFASTACVYPMWKQTQWDSVLKEDDAFDRVQPESGYGWAKLCAEILLEKMRLADELPDVSVLRLFNVYGPGEEYGPGSHVIPELLRKVLFEDSIEVYGDGSQARCFLYVDDAVDAYMKALDTRFEGPINIGNPSAIRIAELVDIMRKLSGDQKEVSYNLDKPVGAMGRVPDLTRAKRILHWEPRVALLQGLAETIVWMKSSTIRNLK